MLKRKIGISSFWMNLVKYEHVLIFPVSFTTSDDEDGCDMDTIEFELKVKCSKNTNPPSDIPDPSEIYKNSKGKFLAIMLKLQT